MEKDQKKAKKFIDLFPGLDSPFILISLALHIPSTFLLQSLKFALQPLFIAPLMILHSTAGERG
jgi:hypothetical protein